MPPCLWRFERRALQQVALFAAAMTTVAATAAQVGRSAGVTSGIGFLALGAAWLELGRRGLLGPDASGLAGPEASGLVVAGSLAGRTVLAGLGAAALFLFAVQAAGLWWRSLGAPLAVLLAGLALLAAAVLLARLRPAARRMVR